MNFRQKCEIARNPSTPADVLVQLATDTNIGVREEIAENPSTPIDTLKALAVDTFIVRIYVARNPSTPVDVLAQLTADEDKWVKRGVARNPSLPLDSAAFKDLMIDPDPRVRAATMQRLARHLVTK